MGFQYLYISLIIFFLGISIYLYKELNKVRKNRVRSFIKKVELAIDDADKTKAEKAFVSAQPEMHRSVTKGVFKKNTISRKLSRLSAKIKKIA